FADGASTTFPVTVFQCKGDPHSLDDCFQTIRPPAGPVGLDGTGVGDAVTNPDGTGSVSIEARPAAYLPALDCTSAAPCSIIAFENDGSVPAGGTLPATAVP